MENNADPNLIDINQIECKRYSHNYNENIKVIATFLNDNSVNCKFTFAEINNNSNINIIRNSNSNRNNLNQLRFNFF